MAGLSFALGSTAFISSEPLPESTALADILLDEDTTGLLSFWDVTGDISERGSGDSAYFGVDNTNGSKTLSKSIDIEPGKVRFALQLDAITHGNAAFYCRVNLYSDSGLEARLSIGAYAVYNGISYEYNGVKCPNYWTQVRRVHEVSAGNINRAEVWINFDRNNLNTDSKKFGVRNIRLECE